MIEKKAKKKRSLFNMEVDAKFYTALRMLRRNDPNMPSGRDVMTTALKEKLRRDLGDEVAKEVGYL